MPMNVLDHLVAGTPLFVAHNDSGYEATLHRIFDGVARISFEPTPGTQREGDVALDDFTEHTEDDGTVWLEVPSHKMTNELDVDLDNLETWQ